MILTSIVHLCEGMKYPCSIPGAFTRILLVKGGPQGASDTAHEKPQVLDGETNGDIYLKVAEKIMNNKIEEIKNKSLGLLHDSVWMIHLSELALSWGAFPSFPKPLGWSSKVVEPPTIRFADLLSAFQHDQHVEPGLVSCAEVEFCNETWTPQKLSKTCKSEWRSTHLKNL